MDVIGALAEGKRGAVARSTEVANYILQSPAEVSTLIEALQVSDEVIVSHAAHAIHTIFQINSALLVPHKDILLTILLENDQWEIIEQLCKIMPFVGCSDSQIAMLTDHLLTVVVEGKSSIGRTCALEAIVRVAEAESFYVPKADGALKFALEKGTKAMQARARRLLAS